MKIPSNIKKFIYIIFISLAIIGIIIFFTGNKKTLHAIKNIKTKFFILGLMFYICVFTFDALRMKILIHGTGYKLSLFESYKIVAFQIFFDVITPFSFGGQPFQIYILHKKKIPGGSATTVVITKLIFGALVLTAIVIWAIFSYSEIYNSVPIFKIIVRIVGIILFISITLFVLGLYNPKITAPILTAIFKFFSKIKILKHPERLEIKIMRHILLARNSFDGFISHKFFYFIMGLFFFFLSFLSIILMVLSFMWGLGIKIPLFLGIALTGSLLFLISFMPTPGASGIGEGIFYLLFKDFVPKHLLGVVIFLWRFFYQYLTAFLGAIVAAHYGQELLSKKTPDT